MSSDPKYSFSNIKVNIKPSSGKKLTVGQYLSLFFLLFSLFILPLSLFLVLSPKIPISTPAKVPITPPGKNKPKPPKRVSFGKAALLNGTNSYITISGSESINPSLGFTIEAWFKPASPEYQAYIVDKMSGSSNSFYILARSEKLYGRDEYVSIFTFEVVNQGNRCATHSITLQKQIPGGQVESITSWQHIAGIVHPDGKMDIFVNGERSTMNFNSITNTCPRDMKIRVGARETLPGVADGFFNGLIDEVRISNIARYPGNFTPPTAPFEPDQYDVVLYHLDGNLNDASENSYRGIKTGKIRFVKSTI